MSVYSEETGKSEYQTHLEWMRGLLVSMQEKGVDDRYGDDVPARLADEIKWLTDKIELAIRERRFIEATGKDSGDYDFRERRVKRLIDDIAACICYPNETCQPNVRTVTNELEGIFSTDLDTHRGEDENIYC